MSAESSVDVCRSMESRGSRKMSRVVSMEQLRTLMLQEAFQDVDNNATAISDSNAFQPVSPPGLDRLSAPPGSSFRLPSDISRQNSISSNKFGRQLSNRLRRSTTASTDPFEDALPVMPIKSNLSMHLKRECQRGIEFLVQLQRPAYSRTSNEAVPNMPRTALQFSKGLAFMWQRKAGLITSWTWGTGFIIARLGPGVWSAPCFLADRFLSLGITAGFKTVDTCYAIPSEIGMHQFKTNMVNGSLDVALTLGTDPFAGDGPQVPMAVVQPGDRSSLTTYASAEQMPKTFQICDGAIFDISWRCGLHMVDDGINEALYGPTVGPQEILDGKVQIPEEFKPLYEAILKLASAPALRQTTSQFSVAKERVKATASKQSSFLKRGTLGGRSSETKSSSLANVQVEKRSLDNTFGSNSSSSSQIPGSSPSQLTNSNPCSAGSSFKLFGDAELLDLDLDAADEDEIQVATIEGTVLDTIAEKNSEAPMFEATMNMASDDSSTTAWPPVSCT